MNHQHTFTDRVAEFLKRNPNVWIPAIRFEAIGGRQAWRTRLSEARRSGMQIENRTQRVKRADGSTYTLSEYRYVPATEPIAQALPLGA